MLYSGNDKRIKRSLIIMKYFLCFVIVLLFSFPAFSATVYYDDPLIVGMGARPWGMSRAFTAIADDSSAVFLNPAGLSTQKNWQISTMNTTLLDEYQYTVVSGVLPLERSTLGFGYVSSGISGILVSGGATGTADYYNSALVLSYATYVGGMLKDYVGGERNIHGGMSFKYFSKGFRGDASATGSGFNLDMGLKYLYDDRLSFGVNFQNILLGASISGDFDPELIPFVIKTGVAYDIKEYRLKLALDNELKFGRSVPWPMHMGVEWRAHEHLVLRTGFDQVAGADGGDMSTNMTFGLGIDYDGLRVDIANVPNFTLTNNASTILSLSYCGNLFVQEKREAVKQEAQPAPAPYVPSRPLDQKITILTPDRLMTYRSSIMLIGSADADIREITINDEVIMQNNNRALMSFSGNIPLNIGRNSLMIYAYDQNDAFITIPRAYYRYYLPIDIPVEQGESRDMEHKFIYTIIRDYLGKDYSIERPMSKEILALIIVKAKKLDATPPEETLISRDVNNIYWAAGVINAIKRSGLMTDETTGYFRPDRNVTREELVKIIFKATGYTMQFPSWMQLSGSATFSDLIEGAYNSGLLNDDIDDAKEFLGISRQTI